MAAIRAIFVKFPVGQDARGSLQVGGQGVTSLVPARVGPEGLVYDVSKQPVDCVVVTRTIQRPGFKSKVSTSAIPLTNISSIDYGEEDAKS